LHREDGEPGPDRRAAPRAIVARLRRVRAAQRCPNRGALASDAWALADSGRERETRGTGRMGHPEKKKRSGLSLDEQEIFLIYSIMF
jgi:hypothetical protein